MYQSLTQHRSLTYKYIQIFCVVCCYWVVSILTVFINKALLSGTEVHINAPLFVTWFQCVISTCICIMMSILSKACPTIISFPSGSPLDSETFRKVLPLSILFTAMIATNNLCLKYVSVAFYYVGRSLTTVFNVIFTYILLGQKTSSKCILCCLAIIFGFLLGVDQESLTDSFSWRGTIFGVFASLSLCLYSIYTKRTLQYVKQEVWLLSYYNNFYSIFLFLPLIFINGELNEILAYEKLFELKFWLAMITGGICGFSIGFVSTLQIKVTSPLTHNISGTAKACAQTIIATQWYQETKSFLWWTSNVIVLVSSALYARIKQLEMETQHKLSQIERKV